MSIHPVSRFTIVRLVPDTIAGECINIAVVTISPGGMLRITALQEWTRVEAFAGPELAAYARDYVEGELAGSTRHDVEWQAENSSGIIQYAPLQPSLEPADALLARLAMRYLKGGE